MTVNYTTNLSLGQPVTGTESGTWGDDVNNAVTSYLDIAIAGGLAITVTTADVTLTLTQGTSVATNIGSTTAQYAILNVSGAMTAARNLIVPSSSRIYLINNNTTGGFALTVKGSATSGVTLVNGEKAHVFWNGTDYAKMSNASGGAGVFSSITNSGLTSGRVVYSTTGGLETDSANLTFNGTTLTANTIGAFTLSGTIAGGGNQINNVIIGTTTPLAGAFTTLSATGVTTVQAGTALLPAIVSTTGTADTGIWFPAADTVAASTAGTERMRINSSGNVGIGTSSPLYKLNVVGADATLVALFSGATNGIRIIPQTTSVEIAATDKTGTVSYQKLDLNGSSLAFLISGTTSMTLNSSGDLGIGTTSPGARLDVQNSNAYGRIKSTSGTYALFDIDSPASMQPIIRFLSNGVEQSRILAPANEGASQLVFATGTSGTERMRIDASGNVGIGTSSNATNVKLQVVSPTNTLINSRGNAYIYTTEAAGIDKGAQLTLGGQYTGGEVPFASIAGRAEAAAGAVQGYMQFGTINSSGVLAERMRISSAGIVTMSAYGAGTATFSAAGVISSVSDETWKIKDGVPVDPDSMLKKLEPGYWYYNDEKKETFGTARELGFYAQNVNAAIGPEAAPTPEEGKPWGYYDRSVLAVTVMSLQKALATIESLTARIEALER